MGCATISTDLISRRGAYEEVAYVHGAAIKQDNDNEQRES